MTLEIDKLRYVGLYEEPAGDSTYGIDNSGTPGDFLALPYMEGSLKVDGDTTNLDPMSGKVEIDAYDVQVTGPKKCSVGFDVALHSHGLDLDGTTSPPSASTWALARLLKIVLGGLTATTAGPANAQTTVQAGSTATSIVVTTGHGSRFARGGVIGIDVYDTGVIEAREIAGVSGDTITLKEALSAAPAEDIPVRGGLTFYASRDPDTSAQVLVEGRELSDRFVFLGLQGGIGFSFAFGQDSAPSKLSFSLSGANWARLADGSGITVPTYSPFELIRSVDAPLTVPTFGSTTRSLVHQADFKLELALQFTDERSGSGVQGIRRKRRIPGRPLAKGSFVERFETQARWASYEAKEARSVFQQLGVTPGGICLVSVPKVQFGQPKRVASGELAGAEVPFWGRNDSTGGTTDLEVAAFRLHFL